MTETEWLTSHDPGTMLSFLEEEVSDRKLWLFVCAALRRKRSPTRAEVMRMVDVIEPFADGEVKTRMLCAAMHKAWGRRVTAKEVKPGSFVLSLALGATNAEWSREEGAQEEQSNVLRDMFGNPFSPVRVAAAALTPTIPALAEAAYQNRSLPEGWLEGARLHILADALEEAGCTEEAILSHLRGQSEHLRGCWVLDLLTGRS